MKLSEFKDEEAFEVFAKLMEPASKLIADKQIQAVFTGNLPKLKAVEIACKKYPKACMALLAILDRQEPKEYHISLPEIPVKLLDVLNDPALLDLFTQQSQTE